MTIVLTLCFLAIAAVFAFAFYRFASARRGEALHAYHGEVALQAARSAAAAALRVWTDRLNDPRDPLHLELKSADLRVHLPRVDDAHHAGLAEFARDFPGLVTRAVGTLGRISALATLPTDPGEKRGEVEVEAEAAFHGAKRRVVYRRPFLFARAGAGALGRFTLFVRSAGDTDFNVLDGDARGGAKGKPLVLVNGPGADPLENGWIYLGGGKVALHLARGGADFGEDFHLPDSVSRSVFFPNQRYALLHLNVGFSSEAAGEPVFDAFPAKDAFRGSVLRLFGCPAAGEAPSPTLVFGDVWRRYLQAAAIGALDGGAIGRVVVMPWTQSGREIPRDPAFPPFLMLSTTMYQIYMSQVREEPYNRSFDTILAGGERPAPLLLRGAVGGRFGSPYPLQDRAVEISGDGGFPLHSGPLSALDPTAALAPRVGMMYDRPEAFLERAGRRDGEGVELELFGAVRIKGDTADLSRVPLRMHGRGAILFEKGASLGEVKLVDPARDRLFIIAERGDLRLMGREVEAGLAALKGGVVPEREIRVRGFLACDRLDPQALRRGGRLDYDPRWNPESPRFAGEYAFASGPSPLSAREE